ncbi:ABC transporter ATP-binding protein [Sulfurisphaera ohwakuensis]|uniref:ATP-binding cassette domain-containing protein n=1 Tax=Sulfurisphaera ohwakuensis TaxID=69656 RepID=A0A650CFL6_SULOH|nr:ABC transporter ATP-binding protein [Sulfurisphaera ohwakuensis]MBB5255133.1 energy-coupling factor transport system ATP-binding protein [Sulfurisphaera ohwakuensis]QGR16614.1 ATP-binding cassette domain-containing protein [Sulfurisphaera ohwakuensis]
MRFLEIKGLRVFYPESSYSLNIDSLEVKEGESILIAGKSGSGKSTLLNSINGVIPHEIEAEEEGEVKVFGIDVKKSTIQQIARYVGTLLQDPDSQIFNYYVIEELAFGAENLNLPKEEILNRINEVSQIVGISHLLNRETFKLSGGEKQRVVLGSILTMNPKALILDEPTSSIDLKGTREILATLRGLKEKISMIIAEHKLKKVLDFVDRVIVLDKGKIIYDIKKDNVKELDFEDLGLEPLKLSSPPEKRRDGEVVLEAKVKVTDGDRVIVDTEIVLKRGISALIGDNGSGKSTLLKALAGILPSNLRFYGSIKVEGKEVSKLPVEKRGEIIAYLPQEIDLMFTKKTVREEVSYPAKIRRKYDERVINDLLKRFNLPEDQDPFLLSVGQKRRVAISSLLATGVKVFLLDEPTTGQDWYNRKMLGEELRSIDASFLVVTHDPIFVYYYADRAYKMVNGRVIPISPEDVIKDW